MIALCSQFVLQYICYESYVHVWVQEFLFSDATVSISKVVCFSLTWSFITCIMVFLGMVVTMDVLESIFRVSSLPTKAITIDDATSPLHKKRTTSKEGDEENEDDVNDTAMFRMEIAYVFGAIAAIILLWTVYDFGIAHQTSSTTTNTPYNNAAWSIDHSIFVWPQSSTLVVLVTMSVMVLIVSAVAVMVHMMRFQNDSRCKVTKSDVDVEDGSIDPKATLSTCTATTSTTPTEWLIYSIASTVGLMVGTGTQMMLSLLLWSNINHVPFVIQSNIHIALFSFGWSTVTVMVTAFACYLLRTLVFHCIVNDTHGTTSCHYKTLLTIRMEAIYIGWTLTGICIGWIILDVLHDMQSQIYISVALFILSLVSFLGILIVFPESDVTHPDEADTQITDTEDEFLLVDENTTKSLTVPLLQSIVA
jgi:hypothetical protein